LYLCDTIFWELRKRGKHPMKAALFHEFGGEITVENVPDPELIPGSVVIKVHANGICRSDWHGWQGHDGDIKTLPHVPGHELAGEIIAVADDVQDWQIGDRVTTPVLPGLWHLP
jgi:alcohol dehydrogenase